MTSGIDYIPGSDSSFDEWQENFMTILVANAPLWGVPPGKVTILQGLQTPWTLTWNIAKNKTTATTQNRKDKDAARKPYEKALRNVVQKDINDNPLVSAGQRASLGLPERDTIKTPSPVPSTIPQVDTTPLAGNRVKIYFKQQVGADGISRRGKPKGVKFIEFCWIVLAAGATPPTNASQCPNHDTATRSPSITNFAPEERGKMVYFFARWLNDKGIGGDWTDRQEFMIP